MSTTDRAQARMYGKDLLNATYESFLLATGAVIGARVGDMFMRRKNTPGFRTSLMQVGGLTIGLVIGRGIVAGAKMVVTLPGNLV